MKQYIILFVDICCCFLLKYSKSRMSGPSWFHHWSALNHFWDFFFFLLGFYHRHNTDYIEKHKYGSIDFVKIKMNHQDCGFKNVANIDLKFHLQIQYVFTTFWSVLILLSLVIVIMVTVIITLKTHYRVVNTNWN